MLKSILTLPVFLIIYALKHCMITGVVLGLSALSYQQLVDPPQKLPTCSEEIAIGTKLERQMSRSLVLEALLIDVYDVSDPEIVLVHMEWQTRSEELRMKLTEMKQTCIGEEVDT